VAEPLSFHTAGMKANLSRALALALPAVLLFTASCSERRIVPAPAPTQTPEPGPPPAPRIDWREARATPGDWVWTGAGGQSSASFANGLLHLRCDRAIGVVVLARRGSANGAVPMTVMTSALTRSFSAAGSAQEISVSLNARDALLDAMAFSRGHFAVEVSGLATLYVPSWPEVSRVIEDCR
jgi:hypothetical protein